MKSTSKKANKMTYDELQKIIEQEGEQKFLQSVAFQRYALYLKEMSGDEDAYNRLMERIQNKISNNSLTIDGDEKAIEIAIPVGESALAESLMLIEEDEELVQRLQNKIEPVNLDLLLKAAGYSDQELESVTSNPSVLYDLKLQKLFHDDIGAAGLEAEEKTNTFVEALKSTKDGILNTLGNPNVKVALGAVGVAAAVFSGGGAFALGLAGARLSTSLFQHKGVEQLMNRHGNTVLGKAQDMGLISENSANAIRRGFSKLKSFMSSKPVAACITLASLGGLAYAGASLFGTDATNLALDPMEVSNAATEATNNAVAEVAQHVVEKGENAWKIAEAHYQHVTGEVPTPQQVVAMVNDMGLDNPGVIKPGETLSLSNDLSKYAADTVGKVQADWLGTTPSPTEIVDAHLELGSALPTSVSIADAYDVSSIAATQFDGAQLSEIAAQNPGLDLHALEAGDEITFNGQTYEVPSAEDLIVQRVFPEGANPLIDKEELASKILEANGIESKTLFVFDNGDLGKQLLEHGPLTIPEVDTSILQPAASEVTVSGMIHGGGSGTHQLQMDILRTCYPDGVPELLDRSAFMDAIKQANPDLNMHLSRDDYYNFKLNIPDMTTPQPDYSPSADPTQLASNRVDDGPSMGM
ncbi:LysM peptidoglycan-binding domain-containing protein [Vibrio owensii]|uniref:LysM peptidoglycan-binding domain-containing protein n=1 Tax=Vibrio owensii TaxID=696485 RepID=UPI003CC65EDE